MKVVLDAMKVVVEWLNPQANGTPVDPGNRLSLALGMLGLTFSLQRICSSLAVRPKGPC